MPLSEQEEVTVAPAVNVTEAGVHVAVRVPAPVTEDDRATAPAKPLVAGGLPKLVTANDTPPVPDAANETLVTFETSL